jgi:pimeloyl-ACP methyl ester carboxylesterase/UDP:flavonoid glycosyltransferase YjiC (YdhE family)
MRAREPDRSGYVARDGVRIYYEIHGEGNEPTVLLLPTWAILDSRHWKMQLPYLARRYRVITFDPRGNGRSDRPATPDGYDDEAYALDAVAVLDETGTASAVVAGLCAGVRWALVLAAKAPERVAGLVAIAPGAPGLAPPHPHRLQYPFDEPLDTDEGWAKVNRYYWERDWEGFARFHAEEMAPEPHSSKVVEDMVEWSLATDAQTLLLDVQAAAFQPTEEEMAQLCRSFAFPVLVIHGSLDRCQPPARGRRLAELTGGELLELPGAGHVPHARHPVAVNHAIAAFVDRVVPPRRPARSTWTAAPARPKRALWVCSPIGLGHVLRDVAIARELRARVPGLEIEWLAQQPVTAVLESAGEAIHPASVELASESAHWESEADGHDLHAFYAFRRMDEIFCANYMLFDDVVRETPYDLWVGDESWEVDYFLHENPERKIAPYAFLTDVVGFLPTDADRDPREAQLCADYNAQLVEQRARFPRVRDESVFIGGWDELPDVPLGPGLPGVREWSVRSFTSVPYVVPFDAAAYRDPAPVRERLGYGTGYPLLVAAVGGTAVGRPLLALIAEGFAELRRTVADARLVLVTGPRIDPAALPDVEGMDKVGYAPMLFEHLAAADLAVVQGGLSTTMELTAAGRPFLYFPIAHHWEQQRFVAHRLAHYRAGVRMDYATATPRSLAAAMKRGLTRRPRYRPVPDDGATRAAELLQRLL